MLGVEFYDWIGHGFDLAGSGINQVGTSKRDALFHAGFLDSSPDFLRSQ